MALSRLTPLPLTLTARDLDILAMTHRYDGLVIEQIKRRFWPSFGARSACYDRIARLIADRYLHAQRLPSLSGRGSGKVFLTLGPRGRPELARELEDPAIAKGRNASPVTPLFVAHHVAIGEVRMAIEQAVLAQDEFFLAEWTSERELRRSPIRVQDPLTLARLPIVPDGAFQLRLEDGESQRFYVEVDMGTVSPKRLRAKLRCYLTHQASELVPVLFVVRDLLRQRAIITWASEEARALSADPTLLWVARLSELTEQSVLVKPVWQVVGVADRQRLVPSDESEQAKSGILRGQLIFRGGARS